MSQNKDKINMIKPIQFHIPTLKWNKYNYIRKQNNKQLDFSPILPGKKNYSFDKENLFIEAYGNTRYAITLKRGGWDCLRHYEIILAGTIPYFLDIENIPEKTMCKFPKKLILKAMSLPGMPSQNQIKDAIFKNQKLIAQKLPTIDQKIFPIRKYQDIRDEIINYTEKNLLCKDIEVKTGEKVFIYGGGSTRWKIDFMRDLLTIGLLEQNKKVFTSLDNDYIFTDYSKPVNHLYGKGFQITHSVPIKYKKNYKYISIANIKNMTDIDTYIVHTESNKGVPKTNPFPSDAVIFIDGNDIYGNHHKPDYCTISYVRELC